MDSLLNRRLLSALADTLEHTLHRSGVVAPTFLVLPQLANRPDGQSGIGRSITSKTAHDFRPQRVDGVLLSVEHSILLSKNVNGSELTNFSCLH